MKQLKQILKILCIALITVITSQTVMIDTQAAEYEIVFKAGAHGTLQGKKQVSYRLSDNDVFPDDPSVETKSGYVFKGWNKELPEVGSKVTGKEVYVARYGVVIDGINYTVRYVDENKVDIATPKTMLGEKGETYTVRAKQVPGYLYQKSQQSFTLDETNKEIMFIYTLTNPDEVIKYKTVYEEEVINQPTAEQNNEQGEVAQGNDDQRNNEPNINNEQENKDDKTEIDDNKQPLAKGSNKQNIQLGVSIAGIGLLLIIIVYVIVRKKKQQKAV